MTVTLLFLLDAFWVWWETSGDLIEINELTGTLHDLGREILTLGDQIIIDDVKNDGGAPCGLPRWQLQLCFLFKEIFPP
jgi:hypothetical protein